MASLTWCIVLGAATAGVSCTARHRTAPGSPRSVEAEVLVAPPTHYGEAAQVAGAQGEVEVELHLDEEGCVEFAAPISGHPLLQALAETSSRKFIFSPGRSGRRFRLRFSFELSPGGGGLTSTFAPPDRVTVTAPRLDPPIMYRSANSR